MKESNVVIGTDAEILAKLPWNKPTKVKDFLLKLAVVKQKHQQLHPKFHEQMMEWGREFETAYNRTYDMHGISKLQYLNAWINLDDYEKVMACAVYFPNDFQVLFARHFVFKK